MGVCVQLCINFILNVPDKNLFCYSYQTQLSFFFFEDVLQSSSEISRGDKTDNLYNIGDAN